MSLRRYPAQTPSTSVVVSGSGLVSAPPVNGESLFNVYRSAAGALTFDSTGTNVASGISSSPPSGAFQINNIYVENGNVTYDASDTPQP